MTRADRRRIERRANGVLDQVAPLATALRWATLALGVLLLVTGRDRADKASLLAAAVVVGNTVWRTLRPVRPDPTTRTAAAIAGLDVVVLTVAVVLSGRADSPFLLTPVPALALVGFGWGTDAGLPAALGVTSAVLLAELAEGATQPVVAVGLQAGVAFFASAAIGGLGRRLSVEAAARQEQTLDQMTRMATANDLLLALHHVAQTLPASLDLGDVVASASRRFAERFDASAAVVAVHDDATGGWRVELAEGVRLPRLLHGEALPEAVRALVRSPRTSTVVVDDFFRVDGQGWSPTARSGMYAVLRTPRGNVVGVVAVEHVDPGRFGDGDAAYLDQMADPLALAVDNALWFGRIRTLAAEAERARIARDLHDRLAQSLAYVGFELERLAAARTPAPPQQLDALNEVVRDVVRELRETLSELRATVTETASLADLAREQLGRMEQRSGIATRLSAQTSGHRLPIQIEKEMWRIAQEALVNVERHAGASRVDVIWLVTDVRARLEVRDDGRGFGAADVGSESFGLVGMRERADAIGARLVVDGESGPGTRVCVEVEVRR